MSATYISNIISMRWIFNETQRNIIYDSHTAVANNTPASAMNDHRK